MTLAIFTPEGTEPDAGAVQQMKNCMAAGDAVGGCLSADHHLGYSMPIGGTIAYPEHVSPSGVGFDIGCGNMAVSTSLHYSDVREDMPRIMDEIVARISFGMGRPNNEPVDHPVFDSIVRSEFKPLAGLVGVARKQLGTVGGGNHYIDIFREEGTDRIWVGVHFGSRGFGHKIASGFMALAQGGSFQDHAPAEDLFGPPVLLHEGDALGYAYIEAMRIAGDYAYAGRETAVAKVLEILGNPAVLDTVHNHHNYAWQENGNWTVRKGATPLFPGQRGFVGGSMGENAVIIEGQPQGTDGLITGGSSLWSAPHGAGRAMSRTEAKGKSKRRWHCGDCGHTQGRGEAAFQSCPKCDSPNTFKVVVQETAGKVDWKAAKADLKSKHIVLRGADADEAPGAYKRLPAVLAAHSAYVDIKHQLVPIGVAMAGPGIKADD